MKNLLLISVLSLSLFACNSEKTLLQLNLEIGKTYTQEMNSEMTVQQEFDGRTMDVDMKIGGKMDYKVIARNADDYTIEVAYQYLNLSMSTPMGMMEFDSESKDSNDLFSRIFNELIGKTFEVTMSTTGKIKEVVGLDHLFDGAFNQFPELSPEQVAQIKAQLQDAYGVDAFKGNIEMVTSIFSDQEVGKGDHWTIETKLSSGMTADMSSDYSLKSLSAEEAVIVGISEIKTDPNESMTQGNGMRMKYDMQGSMDSEITVDRASGWIKKAVIKQKIGGKTTIEGNAQLPGGMTLPMTMTSTMTITE